MKWFLNDALCQLNKQSRILTFCVKLQWHMETWNNFCRSLVILWVKPLLCTRDDAFFSVPLPKSWRPVSFLCREGARCSTRRWREPHLLCGQHINLWVFFWYLNILLIKFNVFPNDRHINLEYFLFLSKISLKNWVNIDQREFGY